MRTLALVGIALGITSAIGAQTNSPTTKSSAVSAIERAARARNLKKVTDRYQPLLLKYTNRYFGPPIDSKNFKAQGLAESGLDSTAKSWVGARGVMQLMPSTYHDIASRRPDFGTIDQPEWNIAAGIMHDRYLWTLYQKDISDDERHRFMFASYNAGEGTIKRAITLAKEKVGPPVWSSVEQIAPTVGRWRYTETLGYVRRIDSAYSKLRTIP
jgi:membrane-bound lytic murein transglycosylase F